MSIATRAATTREAILHKIHQPLEIPFSRVVVLRNPASTHAKQITERISVLQDICGAGRVTVLETAEAGDEANRALLRKHAAGFGPDTLLCVGAGDGTVNLVIETFVIGEGIPPEARKTPILPLWGGNANDLAHMLNGTYTRAHLRNILTHGEIVAIHPLACQLRAPSEVPTTRIAACYASFGATAFAAAKLNEAEHRNHPWLRIPGGRMLRECITGFSALMEAPTFHVKEQGKLRVVYERTFVSGPRFAKLGRLPFNLTDDVFYIHTLGNKRLLSVVPRVLRFLQKRFAGRFMQSHAHFTVQETTLAQFDGETTEIKSGTKVSVQMSEQPFYVLSTLLAEKH